MRIPHESLADLLKQGTRCVVALAGKAEFLRDEGARLVAASLDAPHRTVYRAGVEGEPVPPLQRILDDARTPTLFGDANLVHLKNAQFLLKAGSEKLLEPALAALPPGCHLLLEFDSLPKNLRLAKALDRAGVVVECDLPEAENPPWHRGPEHDTPLARWLAGRARSRGLRLGVELAWRITRRAGSDLRTLDSEIEKLLLWAGPLDEEAIDGLVADRRKEQIFTLTDAVFSNQRGLALATLRRIHDEGIAGEKGTDDETGLALRTLATLAGRWRKLVQVDAAMRALGRPTRDAVAKHLDMRPFFAGKCMEQVAHFRERLPGLVRLFYRADRDLKASGLPPRCLGERLVLDILRRAK